MFRQVRQTQSAHSTGNIIMIIITFFPPTDVKYLVSSEAINGDQQKLSGVITT